MNAKLGEYNRTAKTTSRRFRVTLPIMVLAFQDNHKDAVAISTTDLFEIVGPAQDDRFTIVRIRGQEFLVFDTDLKQYATPLDDNAARSWTQVAA